MFKEKITKLLMTLFLSSSILSLIACSSNKINDQIVDENNIEIWDQTLSKLQGDVKGSDFFAGFSVQNTLKYIKKEKGINNSVFINADKEGAKALLPGNNTIKSEIRWRAKTESVDIKLISVPEYSQFLEGKLTSEFNLTTQDTYQNIIDTLRKDINREEVSINFSDKAIDLNSNLVAGNRKYNIKFSYNTEKSGFDCEKEIAVTVIKTDDDSLHEISQSNWDIANFTTDNTYNDVLSAIKNKISNFKIENSNLDKEKINVTLIIGDKNLSNYLEENSSKIKVQLKYGDFIKNITVNLNNFKTSYLDSEMKKVDEEMLGFSSEHSYDDVLKTIKTTIKNDVEVVFANTEIKLNKKLKMDDEDIAINFKFNQLIKSKLIKIKNVDTPFKVLSKIATNIEYKFKEELFWRADQTYRDILNKINEFIENKWIKAELNTKLETISILENKITFGENVRFFLLSLKNSSDKIEESEILPLHLSLEIRKLET